MTQQDDITQRLRDNADLDEAEHGNARVVQLEREAADEIERLRAELSKLRAPVADERAALRRALEGMLAVFACGAPQGESPTIDAARAALASAPVAGEQPIKLSDDVLHFLKEGVENATQCEEADVDHEFADQLLLLMHTPLYTGPRPKQRKVDWGPLVVAPVAGEAIGYVDSLYLACRQRGLPCNGTIHRMPTSDATAPLYAAPQASAENDREAWAADMLAAGAMHLGGECWEWESEDFLFHLWQVATRRQRAAPPAPSQPTD